MEPVTIRRKRTSKWVPTIVILFGVLFMCIAAMLVYKENADRKRCTQPVTATVVELRERRSTDPDDGAVRVTYAPVFEYVYEGYVYTVLSTHSAAPPQFSVGQEVVISLDPDDPASIYVAADATGWVLGIIFLGVALPPILIGTIWLILLVRASKRAGTDEIEFPVYIVSRKEAQELFDER